MDKDRPTPPFSPLGRRRRSPWRTGLSRAATAAVVGAGLAASAHAADMVVLESEIPTLHPGTILPEETPVDVAPGRRALVIDAHGVTRIVQGPCRETLWACARREAVGGKGEDADPVRSDLLPRLGAIRDR